MHARQLTSYTLKRVRKQDGAVGAQIVHGAMNLAHDIAEDPVGELQVDSHEGETAHEDQGGHHQVDQQDVGHSSQLLKPKKEFISALK